jgi:hypothetical protein
MWQAGIVHIVYTDYSPNTMCNEEIANRKGALLMLINPTITVYEDFALPRPTTETHIRLTMKFIPKNDVLPNN